MQLFKIDRCGILMTYIPLFFERFLPRKKKVNLLIFNIITP